MKTVRTSVVLLFLTIGVIPKATAAELTRVRVGVLATRRVLPDLYCAEKGLFGKARPRRRVWYIFKAARR